MALLDQPIIDIINKQIKGIVCIYLFGSYPEGRAKKGSDIDIAVLAEEELNSVTLWEMSSLLRDKIKKDIDLIDLKSVSTVMKAQVVAKGRCIYESDKNRKEVFEMYTLSDYARLNEERKEILDRIKREGLVYAR